MAAQQRVSCGREFHVSYDINSNLEDACKAGFDFVCMPIVNPRFKREFADTPAKNRTGALTRSDLLLTSNDWSSLIVAMMSSWLQVDSGHEIIRKNSEKALKQELMYSSHLGVPAVMLSLTSGKCANLAHIIHQHILHGHSQQFWIRVPVKSAEDQCDDVVERGQGDAGSDDMNEWRHDTWKWWHTLRTLCDSHKKLGLVLEISADLPSQDVLDRWCGEPVRAVILPTSVFLTNKKGFPVLSRPHQTFLRRLFKLEVQVVLSGVERHGDKGLHTYQLYLDHLWKTQDPPDHVAQFARGYEDYLQCPLQPLMDNLESQTYEVFEKDPVKYSQYQKAIHEALLDRVPEDVSLTTTTIVMVLGAGRGPLVTASLRASETSRRKIRVYAVEKNPNAVITLENLQQDLWGDTVTIVSGDMRYWNAPEKADIIVSELLGSFGDNELSPECLDGAQSFLKPNGISIPCEYTSYVAPLSSSKLWNEAKVCRDTNKPPESQFETPYVVRLHNSKLLAEPKPLFTFTHPSTGVPDNNRYGNLQFDVTIDTALHGFGGYFYCILYKDISISIVPQMHTGGMFSWFPIYFPIKSPLYLHQGDSLVVHFWRVNNAKSVWYEWSITEPIPQPIHNPKGRSYTIGL